MGKYQNIKQLLEKIYGEEKGRRAFTKIYSLMKKYPISPKRNNGYFSQDDVILITYGDTLYKNGEKPLFTIHEFTSRFLAGTFSHIHVLPFYPFSSDDGFSVMDFFSVNPTLGSWQDIDSAGTDFKLMFDLVLNHISAKSKWFEYYLEKKEGFKDFAIEVDPSIDLSAVTRPRSLPLLTEVKKQSGEIVHVWTTFSADQIDLNFKSIDVLEKMVEVLLFYVHKGAAIIRLDAIAYLWKETGTSCIHLKQTHEVVKLFRLILDEVAPHVMILTETNVPHHENISYFGDGDNEAQMVYNFTLPPLLLYSFLKEDTSVLSNWAKGLDLKSDSNTFFNFTASHDGIGVRPLEGILPVEEIHFLVETIKNNGGRVSCKKNSDGSESPYELNITYVDALLNRKFDPDRYHAQRFLASQAIQYVLPGVPATYIHSLIGSRNWEEGVRETGVARAINRKKLRSDDVISQLENYDTFRFSIFYAYIHMIKVRKKQSAFHPNAGFDILHIDPRIFTIARYGEDQTIYALTNISSLQVSCTLKRGGVPPLMKDLLTGEMFSINSIRLNPYQFIWLTV
ncbi:MAG: sugar phosphorylase [Thermodesulfobacteriota bacterium]|nr:sugar phosphorylase [Thermodesulfobacteriota bacterium]